MKKISLIIGLLVVSQSAFAHISYSNRNFGVFDGLTSASSTISNQTVTSNYGWADAADGILGDSHKGRAFRFTLQNEAWVDFSVSANATATAASVGGLLPGFSIYSGLAAIAPYATSQTNLSSSADHDFNAASVAWRDSWAAANLGAGKTAANTDGSWNALGDWKIGGDGDLAGDFSQLSSFTYKASAASSTNFVTGRFLLGAGAYTIFIGGNDISNKTDLVNSVKAYGLSATLSVTAVPETDTYAMLLAGLGVMVTVVRRRTKA